MWRAIHNPSRALSGSECLFVSVRGKMLQIHLGSKWAVMLHYGLLVQSPLLLSISTVGIIVSSSLDVRWRVVGTRRRFESGSYLLLHTVDFQGGRWTSRGSAISSEMNWTCQDWGKWNTKYLWHFNTWNRSNEGRRPFVSVSRNEVDKSDMIRYVAWLSSSTNSSHLDWSPSPSRTSTTRTYFYQVLSRLSI